MSLALYRKYRPKTFADLFGQAGASEVLKNAARQNKLAHAYLFHGPRGTGKTTIARLVAKVANCETRKAFQDFHAKGEPCNECARCGEIDAGRALDVVEVDAASNRGIDEIRGLKEGVRLSPSSYDYKVFIIDEVHMLTREAFNALLKTLEEPPKHALLILATTEFEKIPATISSRCQRFHFRKVGIEDIVKKLTMVAKKEKLRADEEALELIATSAEGSLRDAESLLDQMASLSENITAAEVERIIGRTGQAKIAEFADLALRADLPGVLKHLAAIGDGGYNLVDFNKELIHYFRRLISLKADPSLEKIFAAELTKKEVGILKNQCRLVDIKKHALLLKSLVRAYSEMRYSPFAAVPLEVAIIEHLQAPL